MTSDPEPGVAVGDLGDLLAAVATSLAAHRDRLNRLDGVAGDGDLGVTVTQAAEAIAAIVPEIRSLSTTDAIRRVGTEIARKAPSTSGTLVAFAFLAAGRVADGGTEDPGARAIPYLEAATGSIAERGKVSVGDRTMLDALRPAVDSYRLAIERGEPVADAARAAAAAADEGARATASMTPTVGRAAWLGDRARDHEDAGARLVAMAFQAAAEHLAGGPASSDAIHRVDSGSHEGRYHAPNGGQEMDPQVVRQRAEAFNTALMAGDMEQAATDLSRELSSNLGSLVAILPLPLAEATVESVEVGGSGYVAVLHLVGEHAEIRLQTRWKERDGRPTIVETSHMTEAAPEPSPVQDEDA